MERISANTIILTGVSSATYDALGRPLTRVLPEGAGSITSTFTWGTSAAAHEIGQLKQQQISGTGVTTYKEIYTFDSIGRPAQTQYTEGANNYYVNTAYSALSGFVDTLTYPTSTSSYRLKLQYEYQNGALLRVKDFNAPTTVFWQANAADARGQVTDATLGNGLRTVKSIDQVTGWVDYIQTGPGGGAAVQNLSYLWDRVGNLTQRQDNNQGLTENAYYDNLYRLDYTTLNGSTNLDLSYAANGNILTKTGVGTYTYYATKLHAVASINTGSGTLSYTYDANGNMTNRSGTTLTWFASNLPKAITKNSQNSSTFQYTAAGARWRHVYKTANVTYTHVYVGSVLEKVAQGSAVDWKHYVFAEGQIVALYSRKSSGVNTLSYLLTDSLGSADVIASSTGAVTVRESFDAFGKRRGTAWGGSPSAGDLTTINGLTRRGYTAHEMLDSTDLIHMNGRVYDPMLARFVSADPYLDGALAGQGWNRFGYVGNNPLSYTDPSGFYTTRTGSLIKWKDGPNNSQNGGMSRDQYSIGSDGTLEVRVNGTRTGPNQVTTQQLAMDTHISNPGGGARREGNGGGTTNPTPETPEPPEPLAPICEGGAPQWIDANITAALATARTLAANVTDGSMPPIGARGVDPVTSARIAPYEQLAANTDWAKVAKTGARLGTAFNIYNVVSGFRSSVADGLFATTDMAVGTALAFVPLAGVPVSIAYSAHGGSKALVNDVRYGTGQCRAP